MKKIITLILALSIAIMTVSVVSYADGVSSAADSETTQLRTLLAPEPLAVEPLAVEPPSDCLHWDSNNLVVYTMNTTVDYVDFAVGFKDIEGKAIKKVWMYFNSVNPTLRIYKENNGTPGELVYTQQVSELSTDLGWKCIPLNVQYICPNGITFVGFRVPKQDGVKFGTDGGPAINSLAFYFRLPYMENFSDSDAYYLGNLKLRVEVGDVDVSESRSPQPTENDTNTPATREKLAAAQKEGKGIVPVKVYNSANAISIDTMRYTGTLSNKVGLEVTNGDATFKFTGGFKVNEAGRLFYPLAYEPNSKYEADMLKFFAKAEAKTDTCTLGGEYTLPKAATITVKTTLPEGAEAYIYNYVAEPFPGKTTFVGKAKVINGKITFEAKTLGEFMFTTEKI